MKSRLKLLAAIIYTAIGALAALSFAVLAINGENMRRWIPTLILAIIITITGIFDIRRHGRK